MLPRVPARLVPSLHCCHFGQADEIGNVIEGLGLLLSTQVTVMQTCAQKIFFGFSSFQKYCRHHHSTVIDITVSTMHRTQMHLNDLDDWCRLSPEQRRRLCENVGHAAAEAGDLLGEVSLEFMYLPYSMIQSQIVISWHQCRKCVK